MAALFDKDVRTINEHLKNIYKDQELIEIATIRKFRIVQTEGQRQVRREVDHYNLDAIKQQGTLNNRGQTTFYFGRDHLTTIPSSRYLSYRP